MKIFTKTNIAHKVLSIVLNFLLIFYSVAPGINASLVYAQEATSTATVEVTPSPSVEPTPLPTPFPSPSVLPEASPEIIPSPSPSAEPSPTDQVENNSSPEPTVGQPNAPPAESPSPSLTPEPSPSAEVIQTAKGHLAATILENTNAQSLQLDLSTQGNVSSASLTTDKADYAPTDTAVITGSDFPKEAQLKLIITADNYRFEDKVTTDGNGQFIYTYQLDGTYRPLYIVEAQSLSGLILASTTFTDSLVIGCTTDAQGANDQPGQKDLTQMCVNSASSTDLGISWNWDDTSFSGNNTGDACSLYDTNGDGLANYALCVGVNGTPTASWVYTTLYSCGNGSSEKCTQPILQINSFSSTCSASVVSGSNPFDSGSDTVANCSVTLSDFVGGSANLLDVCSFPSGQPNSDPSDCILLRDRTGKLEVVKDLVPDSDTGLFNLQIDGQTEAPNVGDGGTTGEKIVSAGTSNPINHTVGETAGTGTSLSSYSTSIICKDLNGTGSIVAQSANTGPLDVPILDEQDIVCTITNTQQNGTLIVKKVVTNDNGGTKVASDFSFQVNSGTATSFEADGQNDLTVNTGTYTITEPAVTGYTTTYDNCTNVVVPANGSATCTITNNDQGPTLTVIKEVTNNNGGTKEAFDFTINVTGTNVSDSSFPGAGSPGTTVTLEPGSYSVTENADSGYNTTYSTDCSGTIALGENKTCTVTNDDKAATLIVKKVVTNDNGGIKTADDFSFSVNGASATVFEADGQNDLTVSAGTYNITEPAVAGYTTTYDNCSDVNIPNGGSATCTITNDDQSGTLIVKKVVTNDNGGNKVASDFSFQVDGAGGVPFEADGQNDLTVDAGTYNITEPAVTGYTTTYDNCSSVVVPNGGSETCTITNNDQAAHVIVIKNMTNNDNGTKTPSDFIMRINGTSVGVGVSFAGADSPGVNTPVNAGTFSVTEDSVTGYTSSTLGDCSGSIANGETKTCTVTNDDQPANLIVIKHVVNDNGGTALASAFTMHINGTSVGTGVSFPGAESPGINTTVKAGSFAITEDSVSGYSSSTSGDCSGTIANGETKICTITNNDIAPTLKLVKSVTNDNGGSKNPVDWTLTATGEEGFSDAGNSTTFHTVKAGVQYTLSESDLSGYTAGAWSCNGGNQTGDKLTLGLSDNVTCTITNNDQAAHLIIIKNVIKDNGGTKEAGDFSGTVTGVIVSGGQSWTGTVTPGVNKTLTSVGAYNVSETADSDYDTTYSDDCNSTIALGETKTCTVTNNDKIPSLTLNKVIVNDNGGTKEPSDWSLYATKDSVGIGGTGPTVSSDSTFSAGTYTLSETGPSGYSASSWVCVGGSQSGDQITLGLGQSATCTITNDDIAPQLTVIKHVITDDGGVAVAGDFTMNVTGTNVLPGASFAGSESGTTVTLDQGSYSVDENVFAGYAKAIGDNCSGIINAGESKTCTITNNDAAGTLIVKKVVINDNGGILNKQDFSFQVGSNSPVAFESDGQNDLTVDAGTYNITEPQVTGYDTTYDNCSNVVVSNGGTQTCTITNNDQAAHIIVIKNVINDNGGSKNPDDFIIHINGTSVGVGVSFAGATGAGVNTQVNVGSFTVTEDSVSGYSGSSSGDCSESIANGETKTCTFTNNDQAGHLIVHKITDPSSDTTTEFSITASGNHPITGATQNITGGATVDYTVDAGTYSVSEADLAGWDETGNTCSSIVVANNATEECTITNTKRGHIVIVKDSINNNAQDFTFHNDFENGNPDTFVLDDDGPSGSATPKERDFEVLPGTFSVSEDSVTGWQQESVICSDGSLISSIEVSPGETVTCTFVNEEFAKIILVKNTIGGDAAFDFDATGSGLPADIDLTTVSGTASQTFEDLDQDNTYSISENVPVGWDLTSSSCTGSGNTPASITPDPGETVICTFTNTKRGHIIVDKMTDPSGDLQGFDFEVSGSGYLDFSLTDTDTPNDQELVPGTYSVSEIVPNGWDQTGATCDNQQTPSNIFLGAGETVHCIFTNTKKGHLIVQKTTIPGGELDLFTIQATGSGTINDQTSPYISDSGDSILTVTPGTYYVTEDPLEGWDETSNGCQGVVVGAGQDVNCTITNTKRGEIIIEKQTIPDGSQQSFEFDPSYDVNFFLTDGQSQNSGLLEPGVYSVSEITPEGWDLTNSSCSDGSDPQSIGLDPGETITCTFINTQRGTISGTKYEVNSDGSIVNVLLGLSDWTIYLFNVETQELLGQQVTDGSGNFSFTNIVQGIYSLVEDLLPGWTQIFAPQSINLNPGDPSTDNNFGNFQNGSIQGVKFNDLNGNGEMDCEDDSNGCELGLEDWTINLSGAKTDSTTTDGDGYYEFTDLGPGSYTVCEEEQPGWQRTRPANSNCETVDITQSNQTSTVDFGNQGRGTITVRKNVDTNGDDQVDLPNVTDWTWDINQEGDFATGDTSQEVPAGSYIISEDQKLGYHVTSVECNNDGVYDPSETIEVSVEPGQDLVCIFTNTRDTGTITILKDIDNNGDGDTTGEVDVRGATNWTWDIADGEQNIATGQEKTLTTDLYTISEDLQTGYALLGWSCSNEQTGTTNSIAIDVRNGSQTTCTFTNQLQPPVLTLTKANDKTGIDVSAGANVLYTLTVTLTGSPLANVSLIDLPPAGFKYRTGSFTASSNTNPGLVVSEPTYASPGAWNLGNMQTGETITLTYIVDIDAATDPGLYKDLAWSKGTSLISSAVLANESSGFFVGTEVNVAKDQGASTGVEVEKIEKREGEVLGASTELPATGANAIWLILATFLLVGGAGLAWKGMTLRKKYE